MRAEGAAWLAEEGVPDDAQCFDCAVECRYVGQNFEIAVPFDPVRDDASTLRGAFDAAHAKTQGFSLPDRAVEAVTFRLKARAEIADAPEIDRPASKQSSSVAAPTKERTAYFGGQACEVPVFERSLLEHGQEFTGPGIIEEPTSTTVVPPGWRCAVLCDGTLDITRQAEAKE